MLESCEALAPPHAGFPREKCGSDSHGEEESAWPLAVTPEEELPGPALRTLAAIVEDACRSPVDLVGTALFWGLLGGSALGLVAAVVALVPRMPLGLVAMVAVAVARRLFRPR